MAKEWNGLPDRIAPDLPLATTTTAGAVTVGSGLTVTAGTVSANAQQPKTEKRAPVQGYAQGIPWSLHLEAYDAYCARWSPQPALIDLEGRNCRGGFHTSELDEFIPGWRERVSEIAQLKERIAELEYEAGIVRPVAAGDASYPNARDVAHTLRNCREDLLTEARFVLWQGRRISSLVGASVKQTALTTEQIESLVKDYCCVQAGDLSRSSMVATEEAMRDALKAAQSIHEQEGAEPAWIVNDLGELGVMIGGRCFFLYKGGSLEYKNVKHDDGTPIMYRIVGKREFGEVCWPLSWVLAGRREDRYTVNLQYHQGLSFGKPQDGDWRELATAPTHATDSERIQADALEEVAKMIEKMPLDAYASESFIRQRECNRQQIVEAIRARIARPSQEQTAQGPANGAYSFARQGLKPTQIDAQLAQPVEQAPPAVACVKCGFTGSPSKANEKSGWNQCGLCGRLQ